MLHTWSLSVEEQFYLVWPLTLVVLVWISQRQSWASQRLRAWTVPVFLLICGVASLAAAEIVLRNDQAAVFFLAPFRIVEFAFGAIMVWLVDRTPKNRLLLEPLVVVGLALVAYPIFTYTEDTVFPGLAALPPCIGTAILIYAGTADKLGCLLNNRIAVGIGLISYSLYLVHWPLFVFYQYRVFRPLEAHEQAGIVVASILIAIAMYFWVELPFRRAAGKPGAWSPASFGLACASLAGILILPATAGWLQDGWPTRMPADVRAAVADLFEKQQQSLQRPRELSRKNAFETEGTRVLVIGDSHAKDLTNALLAANDRLGGTLEIIPQLISYYCQLFIGEREPMRYLPEKKARKCNIVMRKLIDGNLVRQADYILLSVRWTDLGVANIKDTIERLKGRSEASIVILGRSAEFGSVPGLLVQYGRLDGFGRVVASAKTDLSHINDTLRAIANELDIVYLPKDVLVCPTEQSCDVLNGSNDLLIYDYGHWTLDGAAFYGDRVFENGFFRLSEKIARLRSAKCCRRPSMDALPRCVYTPRGVQSCNAQPEHKHKEEPSWLNDPSSTPSSSRRA